MREIKFRAWCKVCKIWPRGPVELLCWEDQTAELHSGGCSKHDDRSHVIEQFTGLWDKNGCEIYEGDIIKTRMTDEHDETERVSFDESNGGFFPFTADMCTAPYGVREIEVIGNIHQNPELLNA